MVGLRKRCTTVYKRDLNPCSELFSPGAPRVFFVPFSFFSIRNSNYVLMLIKMKIELHESGIFLGYLTDVNPVIIHWLSSNERVIYWKKYVKERHFRLIRSSVGMKILHAMKLKCIIKWWPQYCKVLTHWHTCIIPVKSEWLSSWNVLLWKIYWFTSRYISASHPYQILS